jgi:nucleoside-diphosphate-sugar epimerase
VVEFSATLPDLARLVHLSGYRVGGQDPATVPWSAQRRTADYARLGAYEASKVESDAVVQATAQELDVPLTIANPSTVIGNSVTGESDQLLGLATTVLDLISGKLRAIPGSPSTFVPVVTVDYLARFMALLPTLEETLGMSYWILDDDTPALPDLLRLVGQHHQVKVPRLRVPVSLLKILPSALTHADPETLSFLSADRYPTGPAGDLARAQGLRHPNVVASLQRWSDYLAHTATVRPAAEADVAGLSSDPRDHEVQ